MGRDTSIRVSAYEKELLEDVRESEFGTDSVPLGEALQAACKGYLDDND